METLAQHLEAAEERDDGGGLRPPVLVAVTLLAVGRGRVMVALRPDGPLWMLPRRPLRPQDSLEEAARRELGSTAEPGHLEQLYTRGEPVRAADERVLEVTYLALGPLTALPPGCRWWGLDNLPALADGHRAVIQAALERLRRQLGHTRIACSLLPEEFTLSELQAVYEAVEARSLDKRNFRKWVLANGLVEPTSRERRDGAHRPARLYRFASHDPAPSV